MGVPVITFAGQTHVARVGASLLTSASLAELIASTPDAYVQLAIDLAHDLPRLATYRQTLRPRLSSSPLLDAPAFTRAFETSLQQVVR
jgi:predicted O-linked N-acetylglucosamine transferase (SPINDLY family)